MVMTQGCVVYSDPIIKVFQLLLLLCCGKQQVEFLNLFLLFYIDCLVMNTVSTADIVRVCVCVRAGEGRRLREDVCCHEVEMTSENSSDDLPIVSAQYTRWMDDHSTTSLIEVHPMDGLTIPLLH
jgi:hypothetical protein